MSKAAAVNAMNEVTSNQSAEVLKLDTTASVPEDIKAFLDEYYPNGLVYLHNSFLAYSDGYWSKQQDHADVQKSITNFYGSGATNAKVRALFLMLRLICVVRHDDFKPNTNYVCFLNGCLDMTTLELVPHTPDFHLQSGRNVEWDQNAAAPVFEKYLLDVFRDDLDRDEKIQFVLEWMGLCLIPDTSFEKFVVCVGEGGNGKSVLLKLMPELVGHENVYSAPIQRLSNRQTIAELDGKLLLTSSEINEDTVMDDGILKQIVSGDSIEGKRVYEYPFTFTPYARIMLATNHLPKLRDVTHAFFRRLVMLKFNRNFTADEMDMNLPVKLKSELAGIFAMAVKGLRDLRERGRFIVPQSSTEASFQYLEESDTIKQFADETLLMSEGEGKGMRPVALYSLYSSWCSAHGLVGKDKANNIMLGKFLSRLGYEKTRSNGRDYWCVKISQIGQEITSKRSAKVSTFVEPVPVTVPETISTVASVVEQPAHTEEQLAA
jgi:putative DNA primase/helicase